MKKVLLTLLLALALPVAAAEAQNIALGERVPEVKVPAWLRGGKPAATPGLTYVEFFHSSNPACTASLEQLRAITDKLGAKLHVVVVTRENEEKIAPPCFRRSSRGTSPSRWTPGAGYSRRSTCSTSRSECWSTAGTGRCGWATHCS